MLVAKGGRIVLRKGYGIADSASDTPATPGTLFHVASIAKMFTAAAILQLDAAGRLQLADSVGRFFPHATGPIRSVTVEQLLAHTAGVRRDFVEPGTPLMGIQREAFLDSVFASPLERPPGGAPAYSNTGYGLLAAIVEEASGDSLARYFQRNLFEPAGMTATVLYGKMALARGLTVARGYETGLPTSRGTMWPADAPVAWGDHGSSGILTTATDLYRWHRALQAGSILDSVRLERYLPSRAKPAVPPYAGWRARTDRFGRTVISHNGATLGFNADYRWYPEESLLIIVLSNSRPLGLGLASAISSGFVADLAFDSVSATAPPPVPVARRVPIDGDMTGDYRLPDGDSFRVDVDRHGLVLSGRGQGAVDLLVASDSSERHRYPSRAERTARALGGYLRGKPSELDALSSDGALDEAMKVAIAAELDTLRSHHGTFEQVEMLGSAPDPIGSLVKGLTDTFARLQFSDGEETYFLQWMSDGAIVGTGWGLSPARTPCRAQSATTFVCYSFFSTTPITVTFGPNGRSLSVTSRLGSATAVAR